MQRHGATIERRCPPCARTAATTWTEAPCTASAPGRPAAARGARVGLLCLAVSHYALGLRSITADNIAKNVVGLGLGIAVRFSLSRW